MPLPLGIWTFLPVRPLHSPFLVRSSACPFYRWGNQESKLSSIISKVSLLLKCPRLDSNQVLTSGAKPSHSTCHLKAEWKGNVDLPRRRVLTASEKRLRTHFHYEKLYFTNMLTCLFCQTPVLPQKKKRQKQRQLPVPKEKEREHLQMNRMLALPAKLMVKLSTQMPLLESNSYTEYLYNIRQHK